MRTYLLYLYTESPLHAGGAEADGSVDLPIQREAATGHPLVWGQSLKGALRQAAYDAGWGDRRDGAADGGTLLDELFGRATSGGDDGPGINGNAGRLVVGDAQLLAVPVPTLKDTFAWATSALALSRLARKHARVRDDRGTRPFPAVPDGGGVCAKDKWADARQVLGPCVVPVRGAKKGESDPVAEWADLIAREGIGDEPFFAPFAGKLREDLIVVDETVMGQLLRECTELSVRVQLNAENKTVANGPFTSEYLPAETLLVSVLTLRDDGAASSGLADRVDELLDGRVLQVGGDETLGKGLVWAHLVKGEADAV
ncbi:type III-B CRISPR module RAMP protein Cmr4 [Nocardiopsis suaedae]|uniref:Type III-B CRISPR module RAMP protein Cmr4 n=1 Tax=Nocardiopsis suaedae TaxID=3018444 RepID=A0ABT4TSW7_9ACTN|nr:type III-B CRISPR module RAMP protein Cmr4 [Nocardiopsis suaedae]MDA2807782.1 type III-B CRISPR module RAMP protein Cmr4 [Nocardiopsis suaedae]